MAETRCDILIIGAGQAAEEIVARCCASGMRVVVAERAKAGGSCVNFGCTPTKTALESARLAALARRAGEFGLRIPTVEADYARVIELAREKAESSNQGVTKRFGEKLIHGHARLAGRDGNGFAVMVGDTKWHAGKVVVDVGTRSLLPKLKGLEQIDFITAENWLFESQLPRRIALIGGGVISIEMCQFYRRMGAEEVTVVDGGAQILAHEDADVAAEVQKMLESEGVAFRLNTRFGEVRQTPGGVVLDCSGEPVVCDRLFVATGRKPNTDDLGLETVGIERDDQGFVPVDKYLHTSVPGIFATGDARGGMMFTHTAWDDARIVAGALLGGNGHSTDRVVPYTVFTDPALGRVGLSERDALKKGLKFEVLRFDMARNAHADEARETTGSIKLLLENGTDKILGASVFGAGGADLVHLYSLLMAAELPASVLREAVISHPTYSEAAQNVLL
jgi:pyruvate/2-oxoglutarate dehydrogenase complex dihydrolipoamide dehydrogenase (E3) component